MSRDHYHCEMLVYSLRLHYLGALYVLTVMGHVVVAKGQELIQAQFLVVIEKVGPETGRRLGILPDTIVRFRLPGGIDPGQYD